MALEAAQQLQPLPPQLLWFRLQLEAQELQQQAWAGVLQIRDRRLEQAGRRCGAGRWSTSCTRLGNATAKPSQAVSKLQQLPLTRSTSSGLGPEGPAGLSAPSATYQRVMRRVSAQVAMQAGAAAVPKKVRWYLQGVAMLRSQSSGDRSHAAHLSAAGWAWPACSCMESCDAPRCGDCHVHAALRW